MQGVETETSVPEPILCQALCWMCSQMFSPSSLAVVRRGRLIPASLLCRVTQLGNGRTESTRASHQFTRLSAPQPYSLLGSCLENSETKDKEVCWVDKGCVLRVLSVGASPVVGSVTARGCSASGCALVQCMELQNQPPTCRFTCDENSMSQRQ